MLYRQALLRTAAGILLTTYYYYYYCCFATITQHPPKNNDTCDSQIGDGLGLLGKSAGLAAEVLPASADPNVFDHDLAILVWKRAELLEQAVGKRGVAGEDGVRHRSRLLYSLSGRMAKGAREQ